MVWIGSLAEMPLWLVIVVIGILFLLIFWLVALIECLTSELSPLEKVFWVFVIILFSIFGALLYFIFRGLKREKILKSKKFKGKRLFRSKHDRIIAGVCGGIAQYLEVDPTVIRLLWVILSIFSFGAGILAYIVAWIIIPRKR